MRSLRWGTLLVLAAACLVAAPAAGAAPGHRFEFNAGGTTGTDDVSGETFDVTFGLSSTSAQDGSGSFTGHSVIVLVGQLSKTTFVLHAVANVNFRPSEPTIVELAFVTCAGVGRTPF